MQHVPIPDRFPVRSGAHDHGRLRNAAGRLDLSLKHATADGQFVVTLQPPATLPAINQMHSWNVMVSTPAEKAAWEAMAPATRDTVSRVFANMGKAIAAYEKTLAYGESLFDRYAEAAIANDARTGQLLSAQEVSGLRLFIGKGQCVTCHNGPLLTDQHFHTTGVPPRNPLEPDLGRAAAVAKVQLDEFNCLGRFSDAKAGQCQELRFMVTEDPALQGAFETPSLRNVALRPPHMHAGQFASLEQVIEHYTKAPTAIVGHSELAHGTQGHTERKPIRLTADEARDLAAFLATLSGPIVEGEVR